MGLNLHPQWLTAGIQHGGGAQAGHVGAGKGFGDGQDSRRVTLERWKLRTVSELPH